MFWMLPNPSTDTPPSAPSDSNTAPPCGAAAVATLVSRLEEFPDPRVQGRVSHQLGEVLLCALFATMCDCDDYTAMATFAQTQLTWLQRYIPLANGAPSHDVFRNVLMALRPEALRQVLTDWVGSIEGRQVCIDGKVSRGAKDPATGRSRLHLLRAWVSDLGLSVGQAACDQKSNELATLPEFLASLELKGAIVTIDAMAGHPEVAQQIHEAQGHYILALKANEKESYDKVREYFQAQCQQQAGSPALPANLGAPTTLHSREIMAQAWSAECDLLRTEEKNRGRYEERTVVAAAVGSWWPKSFLWYGVQSVICVVRRTMRQRASSDVPTQEVHYYLSDLPPEAKVLGPYIRHHWSVENQSHHVLDVTFQEDHHQVRDRVAVQNITNLREISAKLLRDHPRKDSIRAKRKRAALSSAFRDELVAPLFTHFDA